MPAEGGSASGGKKIICHDHDGKNYEVDASQLTFRPSIYGLLFEDNKILLSKQWDGYDFPGGGVHIHETVDEALKREFFEETGVKVEPIKPFYCTTSFFHPAQTPKEIKDDVYWNCVLIYYLVKKVGGELSKEHFDENEQYYADMPEWHDVTKLSELKYYNAVDSLEVVKQGLEFLKKQ
jgi:ADP-ribose pyrophosphatase YjhB (NUDIX family)